MAVFRIDKTKDYTVMANHHLRNKALSLKAKGLLSLMLSLPDDWDYTTKGLAMICKDGVDSICSTVRELENAGYIQRRRIRDDHGRLGEIEYTILERPVETEPSPKRENPVLENPVLENPEQAEPEQEKPGLLNTNKQITEEKNTDYINYSSNPIPSLESFPCESGNVDNTETGRERKGQKINNYDLWERQIKTNIDYESLKINYPYELQLIDEIVAIMVETVMSNRAMIRIAGDDYPFSVVKEKFLQIDYSHMQFIIDCFNEGARNTEIKNVKQYMKAVIFNAPTTIDSYYTAKVRYDMPWLGKNHAEE